MLKNKKVAFVFAHIDDEIICAYDLIKQNNSLVLICGNGNCVYRTPEIARIRRQIFDKMWQLENVRTVILDKYDDETLDKCFRPELADDIKRELDKFMPEVVVTHYSDDLHFDHREVSLATKVAIRRLESVEELLEAYSTESSFMSNDVFNIHHDLDKSALLAKEAALDLHRNNCRMVLKPATSERFRTIWRRF